MYHRQEGLSIKGQGGFMGKTECVKDGSDGREMLRFGVIGLDHNHIYGMCDGLVEAGAAVCAVYDRDTEKAEEFCRRYPGVRRAACEEEILGDRSTSLVASAIRPDLRSGLGIRVMESGKDFFGDIPGMLTLEEVERVRLSCRETGRKYMVYFSERLHVEGALFAQQLIGEGRIGEVLQVTILAPHRLDKEARPGWFFTREKGGGIITDIGSHQIEQFLAYTGEEEAWVLHSGVANYANKDHPDFEDFGEGVLRTKKGVTCFFRVDWFTPDGLGTWGDGRVFIMGAKGSIEIRKYINVAESRDRDNVFLVTAEGEEKFVVTGKTGFPFFGRLIRDCMDRTETAMTQEHVLNAMRITIEAENRAQRL